MVKLVTTQSVTLTTPVLDSKGNPVTEKIKFNRREVTSQVVDHHRHKAGELIDVSRELADELVSKNIARVPEAALDDEVDPTKPAADDTLS
jgi:hypothetical protein